MLVEDRRDVGVGRGGLGLRGERQRGQEAVSKDATQRPHGAPRVSYFAAGLLVPVRPYSTVTDFARLRGLSTSVPRATAVWYASSCSGTTCRIGDSGP